jgi:hypothetical protein
VTFASEAHVTISISNLPHVPNRDRTRVEIIHPGTASWTPIRDAETRDGRFRVTVPVQRGCALVRLFSSG